MPRILISVTFGLLISIQLSSQNDSLKIDRLKRRIELQLPDSTYWDSVYYDRERSYGFTLGTELGKNKGIELGIGRINKGIIGHHMSNYGIYLGTEIIWTESADKTIWGPKIGLWFDGGSSLGAGGFNFVYYTNQNEAHLRLRPEIGLGLMGFQIVYGYNIRLGNSKVYWINDHNFKISYSFGVFSKKRIQLTYKEGFEKYKLRKLNNVL